MKARQHGAVDGVGFPRALRGLAVLLAASLALTVSEDSQAYIPPVEQILRSMAFRVARFEALTVEQVTRREAQAGAQETPVYKERILLRAPDSIRSELLEGSGHKGAQEDLRYGHLFLLSPPERIARFLRSLNIDLGQVSYTRLEGFIAYRIGGKERKASKLLVEKDTFLPLLLVYPATGSADRVSVHFRDYRRVGQGWYPFQVTYMHPDGPTLKQTVHSVRLAGQDGSTSGGTPSTSWDARKEEQVRQLLRAFEGM